MAQCLQWRALARQTTPVWGETQLQSRLIACEAFFSFSLSWRESFPQMFAMAEEVEKEDRRA